MGPFGIPFGGQVDQFEKSGVFVEFMPNTDDPEIIRVIWMVIAA